MIDYRLHVFRQVAEVRSLTKASKALHLSQPAVSKHIKLLEEELHGPLFVRSSTEAIKRMVAAGAGIGCVSRLSVKQELASGQLVEIHCAKLQLKRSFSVLIPQGPDPIGIVQAFSKFLLQPLENDGWPEAIDIARAILVLDPFLSTFRGRHKNVADAVKRLVERSFKLRVREGSFEFYDGELERATKLIQGKLSELGAGPFLSNLFGFMSSVCAPYERMYMVPRDYTSWDRMPSIPFNFLINLAVSTPLKGQDANDPASIWTDVIQLSRDLIATLDLSHFVKRISTPLTYRAFDPVFEFVERN